jgi:transcriptional regulator with XRE-family HTH domain
VKKNRKASRAALANLAHNLKRLRKARGCTQQDLARRTGLGQGYIGDIERESVNATLANLEVLANGLDCSLIDLFFLSKEGPTMITHRKPSAKILGYLAVNLKALRTARGYTQEELARLCGFVPSYIGDLEQQTVNVTLANLEAVAKGLGCMAYVLLLKPIIGPGIFGTSDEQES